MKSKIVLFLFISQSVSYASTPIIGGSSVTQSSWIAKTVVALVSQSRQGEALCTASIVAPDLVVTAAHCVTTPDRSKIQSLQLIFDSNIHQASSEKIRTVDRVLVPAEWNPRETQNQNTSDISKWEKKLSLRVMESAMLAII